MSVACACPSRVVCVKASSLTLCLLCLSRRSAGLTCDEVCELCALLPNLRGLQWAWSFEGADALARALTALPSTMRYLSMDITDAEQHAPLSLDEWAGFGRLGLRELCVGVDGDERFAASAGFRLEVTARISQQMSSAVGDHAVLVSRECVQQSVLHGLFLPGLSQEQEWLTHPDCERGRAHRASALAAFAHRAR